MKNERRIEDAHALNAPGDSYVQDGMCLACTAPEHEAPDLMSHSEAGGHHCYFKRQPLTPCEHEQAIQAVAVGCCGAVRYAGTDPDILRRLLEFNVRDECDHAA